MGEIQFKQKKNYSLKVPRRRGSQNSTHGSKLGKGKKLILGECPK